MSLVVLCPTRGRPDNARQAYLSFLATKTRIDSTFLCVIDADDPEFEHYRDQFVFNGDTYRLPSINPPHAGGMGNALNAAAARVAKGSDIVGFIGDDHRFKTQNWDTHFRDALTKIGGGIAYGNDLLQGINLPTQVFITADIINTLGWMALPGAKHLYLDDTWKTLGESLDRLLYFPDLIIEHLHPAVGKAAWDPSYERVNNPEMYAHDAEVYERWKANDLDRDLAALRAVLDRHGDLSSVE